MRRFSLPRFLLILGLSCLACLAVWQGWIGGGKPPKGADNVAAVEQVPTRSPTEYETFVKAVISLARDEDDQKDPFDAQVLFSADIPNGDGELIIERKGVTFRLKLQPMAEIPTITGMRTPAAGQPTDRLKVVWSPKQTNLGSTDLLGPAKVKLFKFPSGTGFTSNPPGKK